ncbi:50S ribosomal protein L4 [Streptobacillus felis]|uniref:Large ribosomal subunit protein uL4 n=1 Tax=Streptobacillus felis TaxID=1384509 RepID=A0A7Z0TAT1_9FUSO|nr:50S ribosomal protein L4 [Streptobacillus felis]NYV28340.1 50S ribosomal protein L4 [Streptobacillus felis]
MSDFNLKVYNLNGEEKGVATVSGEIFGLEPNKYVMHEVLTAELAASRAGTASTKTRGEVSGGGRKPFRQKGTGRARQGSTRAPHMVGGGVVHGPKPRNYEKKVNKKVRKLALKSALAVRIQNGDVIVLEDYMLDAPKTKTFVNFTEKVNMVEDKKLFIVNDYLEDADWNLYLSVRNIEKTEILDPRELSVYALLKYNKVVITKEALATIEEVLG